MKVASNLRYPLDALFSVRSHIAILRALQNTKEGMSARGVARAAGVNHQACAVALRKLEQLGAVSRMGSGRTQLLRLNRESHLVSDLILPLLRKERQWISIVHTAVVQAFEQSALTITVFGSTARGEDTPGSDLDVLVVARHIYDKNAVLRSAALDNSDFMNRFGVRCSPVVLTLAEAKSRIRNKDKLVKNILKEGLDLLPIRLRMVAQ